jgi:hypothetical protein
MGSTRYPERRFGVSLAFLLGTLVTGGAARAQDASTPPPPAPEAASPAQAPLAAAPAAETELTQCGATQVGTGEGQLRPLGHGFYADGKRVRRGCTLLLRRPVKNRAPEAFAPDAFRPLGCGFIRYAASVYWSQALSDEDHVSEPNGQRADVLTRLDLADAETFEVDAECRPRDARFFYLNQAARSELPAFVAVPRGDGQGYEELGCGFVRYEGRVFFGTRLVEGAHAPSFTSVLGRLPYVECGTGMYGKDKAKVWWQQELLRGAKAKTFRIPKDENPEFRVSCDGRRSFQLASLDKRPNLLCRAAKKPVKKRK